MMDATPGSTGAISADSHDVIGKGGQATVIRARDGHGHRLSKVYDADTEVDGESLLELVSWRNRLSARDMHFLDSRAAWPLDVRDHDGNVSFQMDEAPAEFYEAASGSTRLRHGTLLFARPDVLAGLGVTVPSAETRVAICAALAELLAWLHARNVAYGDLSGRNVLWRADPTPGVFLLDCDGCSIDGSWPACEAVDTPGWAIPEGTRKPTIPADCFRFALFVLRSLGTSFQEREPAELENRLDSGTLELLRQSLNPKPSSRPPLSSWASHLRSASVRIAPDDWRAEVVEVRGEEVRVSLSMKDLVAAAVDFSSAGDRAQRSATRVLRAYCAVAREPSGHACRMFKIDRALHAWSEAAAEIGPSLQLLPTVPFPEDAECHFAAALATGTLEQPESTTNDVAAPHASQLHLLVRWWPVTPVCRSPELAAVIRNSALALALREWGTNAAAVMAEGWKQDPTGDASLRYWTGSEWTKQVREGQLVRTERLRLHLPRESPLDLVISEAMPFQSMLGER